VKWQTLVASSADSLSNSSCITRNFALRNLICASVKPQAMQCKRRIQPRGQILKWQYEPARMVRSAQLAASTFNRPDQYAKRPDNRAYCFAELAVSSLAVAETIASTHCAYPRRDGQAELACVAGYIPRWYTRPKTVNHPRTNRAQCRVTSFIRPTLLLLRQTAMQFLRRET